MERPQKHIIRKLFVDVQYNGSMNGLDLQRDITDWCRQQLLPQLEQLLEGYFSEADRVQISKLELDATVYEPVLSQPELSQAINRQLTEKLDRQINTADEMLKQSLERSFEQQFVFFLVKGYLPWWTTISSGDFMVQLAQWLESEAKKTNLLLAALQRQAARKRLLFILPDDLYWKLLEILFPTWAAEISMVVADVHALLPAVAPGQQKTFLQAQKLSLLDSLLPQPADFASAFASRLVVNLGEEEFSISPDLLPGSFAHPAVHRALSTITPSLFSKKGSDTAGMAQHKIPGHPVTDEEINAQQQGKPRTQPASPNRQRPADEAPQTPVDPNQEEGKKIKQQADAAAQFGKKAPATGEPPAEKKEVITDHDLDKDQKWDGKTETKKADTISPAGQPVLPPKENFSTKNIQSATFPVDKNPEEISDLLLPEPQAQTSAIPAQGTIDKQQEDIPNKSDESFGKIKNEGSGIKPGTKRESSPLMPTAPKAADALPGDVDPGEGAVQDKGYGTNDSIIDPPGADTAIDENTGQALPPNLQEIREKTSPEPHAIPPELYELTGDDDAIYITNSGLILLAPFLPVFFHRMQLLENSSVTNPAKALLLLHHLATGQTKTDEYECVLPKILCGLPPEHPVDLRLPWDPQWAVECTDLLLSVIEYWSVLKDTSPEGLRDAFLQRKGKLSVTPEGDWLLQVEQMPYDMLLQHLPWNISMIKLTWMQQVIKTDWT